MREIEKSYELICKDGLFILVQNAGGIYYISNYNYASLMRLIEESRHHDFWVDVSKHIYDTYKTEDSTVYHITQTELYDLRNFRPELFI